VRERIVVGMGAPPGVGMASCRGVSGCVSGPASVVRSARPSPADARPRGDGAVESSAAPRGTRSNRQSCHGGLFAARLALRSRFIASLRPDRHWGRSALGPRPSCLRRPPWSDSGGHPPMVATRAGSRGAPGWPRAWRSPRRAGDAVLRARRAHAAHAGHARLRLGLVLFLCLFSVSRGANRAILQDSGHRVPSPSARGPPGEARVPSAIRESDARGHGNRWRGPSGDPRAGRPSSTRAPPP
jgi:hypothetical protein